MRLAGAPAIEDDEVAGLELRMVGGLDPSGEVDARDHRPAPHDGGAASDGEAVLVVQRRMGNADGDVAFHQVGLGELAEGDAGAGFALAGDQGLEGRHELTPGKLSFP